MKTQRLTQICINHLVWEDERCINCDGYVSDCENYRPSGATEIPLRTGALAYRNLKYEKRAKR